MENLPQLRNLFETLRAASWWQRLFSWSSIQQQSMDAWQEITELASRLSGISNERDELKTRSQVTEQRAQSAEQRARELQESLTRAEDRLQSQHTLHLQEKESLNQRLTEKQTALRQREDQLLSMRNAEEQLKAKLQSQIDQALNLQQVFERDKLQLQEAEKKKLADHHEKLRQTWSEHQNLVQQAVKRICAQRGIEYVTEFSFSGIPDNAVRIADEIIVFDAKSPASPEEFGNFRTYLRNQCELAGKYAKQEGVRKDIYMVIPTNAASVLQSTSFESGSYRVYIITMDALEPVLVTLQQLEAYKIIQEIGPDERQAIIRIIGSLIYASKRRIQVDQYFNGALLDLIRDIQKEVPATILEEVVKVEQSMKLNPGLDRRSKGIDAEALEKTHRQQGALAAGQEAPTPKRIDLQQ